MAKSKFLISEDNLWKTFNIMGQRYLFGKYGQNQQIIIEFELLIETASCVNNTTASKTVNTYKMSKICSESKYAA